MSNTKVRLTTVERNTGNKVVESLSLSLVGRLMYKLYRESGRGLFDANALADKALARLKERKAEYIHPGIPGDTIGAYEFEVLS